MRKDVTKDYLMLQCLIRGLTDEFNFKHLGTCYDNIEYIDWLNEVGVSKDKIDAIVKIVDDFSHLIGYYDIRDDIGDIIYINFKED